MTNGKETKMHNTEKKKQLADRKKPQEHTIEELIDLSKNFTLLSIFL
jgi:hypothetical protein